MSEDTRRMLKLAEPTEPPLKPYMNPFPPKGKVYDYMFVKEVCIVFAIGCHNMCLLITASAKYS